MVSLSLIATQILCVYAKNNSIGSTEQNYLITQNACTKYGMEFALVV